MSKQSSSRLERSFDLLQTTVLKKLNPKQVYQLTYNEEYEPDKKGITYYIFHYPDDSMKCTCPDHYFRNVICKHMMRVMLQQLANNKRKRDQNDDEDQEVVQPTKKKQRLQNDQNQDQEDPFLNKTYQFKDNHGNLYDDCILIKHSRKTVTFSIPSFQNKNIRFNKDETGTLLLKHKKGTIHQVQSINQ